MDELPLVGDAVSPVETTVDGGSQPCGVGMKERVLVYRSELLPPSETFVVAQAHALRRYAPMLLGLRRLARSLPLREDVVITPSPLFSRWGRMGLDRVVAVPPGLVRAAKKAHASLLHAHFAVDGAEALPLARRLRLPLAVTLHGYDVMREDAAHAGDRRGQMFLARRKELWEQASVFLCVSGAIRDAAERRGFPAEKLRLHYTGIDTEAHAFQPDLSSEPLVLFVGRLVEKKGCRVLVEAMARVRELLPTAQLHVIGDGPERAALEAMAQQIAPGTRFLGSLPPEDVRAWMARSRCLAVPSLTARDGDAEGMPTVLLEAMAAGLPVVSTRSSGIPELIVHGEHGLLCEERDVHALAAHIFRVCTEDAATELRRRAARARVEESFDIQKQTAALESVYDEVVREHAVTRQVDATRKPREHSRESVAVSSGETQVSEASARTAVPSLRRQVAWIFSGNGLSMVCQALAFLLIGRMLGAQSYGAFAGAVAMVNIGSQFSSVGMEMVLLRSVARDAGAFRVLWGRALLLAGAGALMLLVLLMIYGRLFLEPALAMLLPYLVLSDALFGKITQMAARALQGAEHARWSAQLLALTNAARLAAAALLLSTWHGKTLVPVLLWARVYLAASASVALFSFATVSRMLGAPRWQSPSLGDLWEGLSFSFSSSSISVYNDIDKAMLASRGMLLAAGWYSAAYRLVDVCSAPIFSVFSAASPRIFRSGAADGPAGAWYATRGLLRPVCLFGIAAAVALSLGAPLFPRVFGHSFLGAVPVLRFLCLLPFLRALHYAWGTAITASTSQWARTAIQAGAAVLNLMLNLALLPRYGWQGAALASLLTDGSLAVASWMVLRWLLARQTESARLEAAV